MSQSSFEILNQNFVDIPRQNENIRDMGYAPFSSKCRKTATRTKKTIKTSSLSFILIYVLNLFLNSALLFLEPYNL